MKKIDNENLNAMESAGAKVGDI
jgi:hypothetical protein